MSSITRISALILCLLFACEVLAQDSQPRVTARLSSPTIGQEETVQLIITISANRQISDIDVQMPDLSDFEKLGERTNRSFSQINNRMEIGLSYIYELLPKRSGTIIIPPVELVVEGQTYQTKQLELRVVQGQTNRDILVRQVPDKRTAFVGEQIVLRVELLWRVVSVSGYDITEAQNADGFIVEEDDSLRPNPPIDTVEIDGVGYNRALLARRILFPLRSGEVSLGSMSFIINYKERRFDFNTRIARRTTPEVTLQIKPLPAGAPENFSGAVGSYEVRRSMPDMSGKANEPLSMSIRLIGAGDMKRISEIQPPVPPGVEVLSAESSSEIGFFNGLWGGDRQWEYIVIPKEKGEISLPEVTFTYFNPNTAQYETTRTDAVSLSIAEGDVQTRVIPAAPVQTGEEEGDIRYIRTRGPQPKPGSPFDSWWFLALVFIPPAINMALLLGKMLSRHMQPKDVRGDRRRTALATALKKIDQLNPRHPDCPRQLKQALMDFFADRIEVDNNRLTLADIRAAMVRRDLHNDSAFVVLNRTIQQCEAMRYAPGASGENQDSLCKNAKKALQDLEGKL